MFKSSENLRLAADMRALERVARPWREARRSWFDGTPESIEARLAATERVLAHARGGVTPAHVELEREASTARSELKEAAHRLLVDPLDDSARAFKGSKRLANAGLSGGDLWQDHGGWFDEMEEDDPHAEVDYDVDPRELRDLRRERREEYPDLYPALDDPAHYSNRRTAKGRDEDDEDVCSDPHEEGCRASLDDGEGFDGYCGNCADRLEDQGHWAHHDASRRSGGSKTDLSGSGTQGWPSAPDQIAASNPPVMNLPGAIGQVALSGSTMTGQEPSVAFNAGPGVSPKAGRRTAGDDHDPYHGKQWPHDFPLPEGTPAKWNDDDTLTCPNCGYDEVELNRRGECPECDHYDADFIDDSDGDHNSFESQMERKHPILPEHGGPESGLWGGKWAPRPFESARLAAGQPTDRRTAAQFGPGHAPTHGFPITEGDEVHYVGPGTKGHPEREKGTVLEYPAMGPNPDDDNDDEHDGEFPYHDLALVYWGTEEDGYLDHAEVDDIVPNQHLNEYARRLRRQSSLRTASGGGLDWTSTFGDDDGTRGHDATTEVGDLLQTHPEYPVGRHPTKPNVKVVHTDQPPVGWGYGIWFNQPVGPDSEFYDGGFGVDEDGNDRDGNLVHAGDNGHTVYPTHDEAKAAAEEHYYSFDHASRGRGYRDPSAAPDSGVDYSDLNKYMDGGDGGAPGDDFDYFGKESRMMARLAASGMSYEDAMAHIDEVLNAGEGHELHRYPGADTGSGTPTSPDHSDIRDHCRACGGDGREPGSFDNCQGCGGTGENQGDPYGECEGCGADTQVEDLTGRLHETELYCPDCVDACDYCGLNGGGHRHGCPER